ncbi:MAG: TonB-dependent receptor, partial [Dehalococcoidia bacterium]|nr:TonB-dependent receptor [Dehalococcoidia bacterium]
YDGRFSPKIALVVTPTPRHALRATVNQAFRAPTALERFTRGAAGPPLTNPRVQETNLDAYFASVQSAVAGGSLPAAVVAGLDVAPLPWRFDSLTLSQSRGNRHLKVERLTAIELGWKGQIGANGYVTVVLFRNDMRDFITLPLPGVNLDYAPFELDSGRTIGVMATLDSLDARLAAQGRPASDPLRASIPGLRTGYQNLSGSASPRLVTTPEGRRALVISFTNASRVIAQGVEIGGSFPLTPLLRVDGSVTYFHSEVREVKLGDRLVSNTPRWKGTLGFRYDDQRLDLSATWRYVEGYDWAAGNFVGPVGASSTLDAACGYRISRRLRGHALVTNLLDQRRYQFFGGAVIGRQALFGMTADF